MTDLLMIGSGSLARSVCHAIAVTHRARTAVTVVARSADKAHDICHVANVRATVSGHPVRFSPAPSYDATEQEPTSILLAHRPRVIVNCASMQSPWEAARWPSGWTALVRSAGFGITLPMQASPAVEVAAAVSRADPAALFVNACYPDAVNPVIRWLGLPVLCGIGNIALLAAALQEALSLPSQADLRMLAHHAHLHAPPSGDQEVRAWIRDQPVADTGKLLVTQRTVNRAELNEVTGYLAAMFLDKLASGADFHAHVPGPLGLPGGYPVRVTDGQLSLDLPPGITPEEAIAWNQDMAVLDGVTITADGVARFSPPARQELARYEPDLAEGFGLSELDDARRALLRLRDKLRKENPAA
jgi:hypothetical protein